MTMLNSTGDRAGALRVFQSCWWLISLICAAVGLLLVPILYLVPAASLLNIHAISESDTKWIIFYLGFSVLLGQLEQLMSAAYTCVARYPYGTFLKTMISLAAFAATMAPVVLGYGPRTAALVFVAANGICVILNKDTTISANEASGWCPRYATVPLVGPIRKVRAPLLRSGASPSQFAATAL